MNEVLKAFTHLHVCLLLALEHFALLMLLSHSFVLQRLFIIFIIIISLQGTGVSKFVLIASSFLGACIESNSIDRFDS